MEKIQTIQKVCDGVVKSMNRLGYAPSTIDSFKHNCCKFLNYALKELGTDTLNDENCAKYLKDSINYPFIKYYGKSLDVIFNSFL